MTLQEKSPGAELVFNAGLDSLILWNILHYITWPYTYALNTVYMLISYKNLLSICGNLLVIISIVYFKQLHTPTNSLILSLAVADLLVGALVSPLTIKYSSTVCHYHYDLFCKVRGTFDVSLCTCSILNLCCISIDRYYAVCQPLTYTAKINHCVIVIMILMSWGVSALIGISLTTVSIQRKICDKTCLNNVVLVNIMGLIFAFYLPMIVMLCIYLKIFLVAQKQARSIQNTASGAAVIRMERKATKTLAIVMGFFLMCWLPFFLTSTIFSFSNASLPDAVLELLNWVALSNSMLNPFIYAFFYSWFRSAFRMIISGKIFLGDCTNLKLS
ncbi:trace amine-associated receptor 1-like [Channa argus]|uniref:trace amine-associated receptor 1-like n=1 Tax=Channa argus TaxID=215402 RepID=UPI0035211050